MNFWERFWKEENFEVIKKCFVIFHTEIPGSSCETDKKELECSQKPVKMFQVYRQISIICPTVSRFCFSLSVVEVSFFFRWNVEWKVINFVCNH